MTIDTWLAYLATVILFVISPGLSHLLMLSNSLSNGFKRSVATAAGDLSANFLQLARLACWRLKHLKTNGRTTGLS